MYRYYIYSIELGNPPSNPIVEIDDLNEAIDICKCVRDTYKVTVYVVDRFPITMYSEVYVSISDDFSINLEKNRIILNKLKMGS